MKRSRQDQKTESDHPFEKASPNPPSIPKLSISYSFFLSIKDILHNKISSFALISVISFVALPLLILGTLREKYLMHLTNAIENQANARRIEFTAPIYSKTDVWITEDFINKLTDAFPIEAVIPRITSMVSVYAGSGVFQEYEIESSSPQDPELYKEHFNGTFTDEHYCAVILNQSHKYLFNNLTIGDSCVFYMMRAVGERLERFPIKCKVLGFVQSGDARKFRIPVNLAQDLELWKLGYAVPKLKLPPAQDQESMFGSAKYESCRFYPFDNRIDAADSVILRLKKLQLLTLTNGSQNFYIIKKQSGDAFLGNEYEDIRSLFFRGAPVIIPITVPVRCRYQNKEFDIQASLQEDPLRFDLLASGHWIIRGGHKFDIVLPQKLFSPLPDRLPLSIKLNIGNDEIDFSPIGLCKGDNAFVSPEIAFRLNLVSSNLAVYIQSNKTFAPQASIIQEKKYVTARAYPRKLQDVIAVVAWLEKQGFTTNSQRGRIDEVRRINTMITNLVLLIGITSFFAVILATAGLMFEAVSRKKKQIGIMRAIGVSQNSILRLFLIEAGLYAMIGYLMANIFQVIFALIADTPHFHSILGLGMKEPVFNSSLGLRLALGLFLLILTIVSGYFPARFASKIEPGVVLSDMRNQ